MSTLLELDLAARLKKAEDSWLAQCDTRLRRAASSVVEEVALRPSRNHPSQATWSERLERPIQKPSMTWRPASSGLVAAPSVTKSGV